MSRHSTRARRITGWLLCALTLFAYFSPQARLLRTLPDAFHVSPGQSAVLDTPFPLTFSVTQASASEDETLSAPRTATISLLRILPLREVPVEVADDLRLYPGGQAIGVALHTQGVLVVGTSDLSTAQSPARMAGIKPGDLITEVHGTPVSSADDLTAIVQAHGQTPLPVTVFRGERTLSLTLTPLPDGMDGALRIGAWVRDSTAGVGTLSFYGQLDGQLRYGALGHAITDADTQQMLTVSAGEIMLADVVDVRKGQSGFPGELKGSFLQEDRVLGTISHNTAAGLYGTLHESLAHPLYPDGLPIGRRDAVHTGPATILSTVDGEGMREYAVEIVEVSRQARSTQRSFVLRVTDEDLLAKTGGIVQGMSGSPIIQDGKLVGAVTHVLVNDPTRGYGIFIENMLEAAD